MKYNINDYIKVKLNDVGKEIFYHRYDALNSYYKNHGMEDIIKPRYPEEDIDGYTKFQIWEFMKLYGEYVVMGRNLLFETEIIIEDAI